MLPIHASEQRHRAKLASNTREQWQQARFAKPRIPLWFPWVWGAMLSVSSNSPNNGAISVFDFWSRLLSSQSGKDLVHLFN